MRKLSLYFVLPVAMSTLFATPFASILVLVTLTVQGTVNGWAIHSLLPAFTGWWLYLWYYGADARFTMPLLISMLIPFAIWFTATLVMIVRLRSPEGGSSSSRCAQPRANAIS